VNESFVENALVVNGNDVKMYGLFCKHTVGHQMVWNGERGSVSFFQCELPYDVDEDFAENGYVGYYVDAKVKAHTGRALGVYSNFQVYNVHAPLGIKVPSDTLVENPFTRFLSNRGSIQCVIEHGKKACGMAVSKSHKGAIGWIGLKDAGQHDCWC
jgi:hypothetical protein